MKKSVFKPMASTLLLTLLLVTAGCNGGGGGSSSSSAEPKTISGFVEDGPVENGVVTLTPLTGSGTSYGPALTDQNGAFSITVPSDADLSGYALYSRNGKDTTTGMNGLDLTGLTLMAPLEMFSNGEIPAAVTPLTTLVAHEMENGTALSQATTGIIEALKLPADSDLSVRPTRTGGDIHARAMMLSLTAAELAKKNPDTTKNPFSMITFTAKGRPDITALPGLEESFKVIEDAAKSGEKTTRAFARKRLSQTVISILDANSPASKKDAPKFKKNLATLIDDIFTAAGDTRIALDSFAPERIIRNVLTTSELATYEDFTGNRFDENTPWVKDSTDIPEIAAAGAAVYDVEEPLFASELVGDDNAKRLNYYYNSNLSHLHKAEYTINKVRDDGLSDEIMNHIAKGKATNGFVDEAKTIVNTQVFRESNKGVGFNNIGHALAEQGKKAEAIEMLAKAEASFKKVITARGAGKMTKDDADNLYQLTRSYLEADAAEPVGALLPYIDDLAETITTFKVYNYIVLAAENICKAYIEKGLTEKASEALSHMIPIASATPPIGTNDYLKLLNLNKCAIIADTLNDKDHTRQIFVEFMNTVYTNYGEDNSTLTTTGDKNKAKTVFHNLFMALYHAGLYDEAEELYAYFDPKGSRQPAIKALLAEIVKTKGLGVAHGTCPASIKDLTGEDILKYKLDLGKYDQTIEDSQLEALTYYSASRPYVAKTLINEKLFDEAELALIRAEAIADTLPDTQMKTDPKDTTVTQGSSKSVYGYCKIAALYAEMGNYDKARALLEKAEPVCSAYSDTTGSDDEETKRKERIYKRELEAIVQGYIAIGDTEKAITLWGEKELNLTDYEAAVKTHLKLGEIEKARTYNDQYLAAARNLFDESSDPSAYDEKANKNEVKHLIKVALKYRQIGDAAKAAAVGREALDRAAQIRSETSRLDFYINDDSSKNSIIEVFADAGAESDAMKLAMSLSQKDRRHEALTTIAKGFALKDDFESKDEGKEKFYFVASVDTDGDGKPNFFSPTATEEQISASGLTLDDDSDNDGTPDTTDPTPFYKD